MIEDIKIFTAKAEELSEILKIKKEAHGYFAQQRPDIYKESEILYTDDFINAFFEDEKKSILVAKVDGYIVGYAFIQSIDIQLSMMTKRKYIYINDLAVSEQCRNKGVASVLLKHIEVVGIEAGASKIELAVHVFSENAIRLYKKNGYKSRTIRMEKELKEATGEEKY